MTRMLLLLCLGCTRTPAPEPEPEPAPTAAHARSCSDGSGRSQPDVVLLTVDTLRADRLGYAGHTAANTPNLDALAARGQAYLQATTPLPRTTPALASLLTGLQPHHHGAREVGDRITVDKTLATQLSTRGWTTVAVSAMKVASPDQGLDAGFHSFDVHHDARARDLTEAALSRVDEVSQDCPLLLWIHYADPHFPYLPPNDTPQPRAPTCRKLGERAAAGKLRRYRLFSNDKGMAQRALPGCSALYDAEITATDAAIGMLIDGLSSRGRSNALIAFTADHGENMGEWGLFFEHGPNVHDASLRVPLVLAGPGIPAARSHAVARVEDITPTLESLLGLPIDAHLPSDGADLSARWRLGSTQPEIALAESGSALHARLTDYLVSGRKQRLHCINGPRMSLCRTSKGKETLHDRTHDPHLKTDVLASQPKEAAVLREAWKHWPIERTRQRIARTSRFALVARPELDGTYSYALYDHLADPEMSHDVSQAHPLVVAQLKDALIAWSAQVDASGTEIKARSAETEAAMRALGYLE